MRSKFTGDDKLNLKITVTKVYRCQSNCLPGKISEENLFYINLIMSELYPIKPLVYI